MNQMVSESSVPAAAVLILSQIKCKHLYVWMEAWCCDRSVCMTWGDILVTAVGSAGGVEECVTTGPFGPTTARLPSLSGSEDMDHLWVSPSGPLCDKPQLTATHSQTGKWQPLVQQLLQQISVLLNFRGSRDCFRPGSGRLGSWGRVRFMSISQWESVPLWCEALEHQVYTAICWTGDDTNAATTCKWRNSSVLSLETLLGLFFQIILPLLCI